MNLAILVSGGLGMSACEYLLCSRHLVKCIFTDSKSVDIINIAELKNIPLFVGNPRNDKGANFIEFFNVDLILSVNYLYIVEPALFSKAKFAVNIHGSLLPKYRGRSPHVWAIINNEQKTGVTAHVIDEGCDTGDIIRQIEVDIDVNDTGFDIIRKFTGVYILLIKEVLQDFENSCVSLNPQNNELFTYFGKRTPEDGLINWNWQKERIRNWVRAQSNPYPGAFTNFMQERLIIDEITYSDFGFDSSFENGLILKLNPILVKTPNGVVELTRIRNRELSSCLKIGQILNQ